MDIQLGKRYRYKRGGFTMEAVVTPEFLSKTGVLCVINYPKCWNLKLKERLLTYEEFESKYKLAETPWQESDHYDGN